MTKKTRRTEINIETHEVKIIRLRGRRFSVYCEFCEAPTRAFTLDATAALFETTLTDVCRLVGAGRLHLVNSKRGLPLVCGNSLGTENRSAFKTPPNQI